MRPSHLVLPAIMLLLFLCIPAIADAQNLILEEMAELDSAFEKTIDAVIFNRPRDIVTAYGNFKKIRLETNAALKQGKITLPKNRKLLKRFAAFDERLQQETEKLVKAAEKNNMTILQIQTGKMLSLCYQCHKIFKK